MRLPEGNQAEVLDAIRRESLTTTELAGVVDLWLGCAERRQLEYLLQHPREALSQAKGTLPAAHDPRLSEDGNRVWKRVGLLLDVLGRLEVWLAHHGRTGPTPEDRAILVPRFRRLARDAGSVAALSQDFVSELEPRGRSPHATRSSGCIMAAPRNAALPVCWESTARAWDACWRITRIAVRGLRTRNVSAGRVCWTRSR